jgi:tRNA A-37 threonylcarbamoyl transferase component Bud32
MYVNIMDTNSCKIHDLLSVKFQKKRFEIFYEEKSLKRLDNNNHIFIIDNQLKNKIQKRIGYIIKNDLIIKLNFPTIPFNLRDSSFYHKHYTPYFFKEEEMIDSANRQWESQNIANKLDIAPKIFVKDIYEGIIYTVMEQIDSNMINIICGKENINFAIKKKNEIIKNLELLHNNGVLHGDILTSSSIYTNEIHNIYYDGKKGVGFIDFGESRHKGENIDMLEFEKWKSIEMELVKQKLFTKISKEQIKYYMDIEKMLHDNYNSNI